MKQIKKLLALVLALAICAAFALPAMADEGTTKTYTLTMNNPQPNHNYKVYQLLKGVPYEESPENWILSNVKAGDDLPEIDSLIFPEGTNSPESVEGLAELLSTFSALELHQFINDNNNTIKSKGAMDIIPGVSDNGAIVWRGLEGGYYLVIDETAEEDIAEGDSLSNVIVKVVGDSVITPKPMEPEPDKEMAEDGDSSPEDRKIGDEITFDLSAAVAVGNLNLYETYILNFIDTMSKGLTFKGGQTLKMTVNYGEFTKEVEITKGEMDGTGLRYATETKEDGSTLFKVFIPNLHDYLKNEEGESINLVNGEVVVKLSYVAILNEEALNVDEVTNKVKLEFTNGPDDEQIGNTTEVEVPVYTFTINGVKLNGNGEKGEDGKLPPLEGVEFELYESDATGKQGNALKFKYSNDGENAGKYVYSTDDDASATVVSKEDGYFGFAGLDAGYYLLKEIRPLDGYNTANDMLFYIEALHNEEGKLTGYKVSKAEIVNGEVGEFSALSSKETEGEVEGGSSISTEFSFEIENKKGSTLPSTGGMGTTIIYIVGAVLVVGAGVLLFTKKRMHG